MPHFEIHAGAVEKAKALHTGLFGSCVAPMPGRSMTVAVAGRDASHSWALAEDRAPHIDDGEGNVVGMITPLQGDN